MLAPKGAILRHAHRLSTCLARVSRPSWPSEHAWAVRAALKAPRSPALSETRLGKRRLGSSANTRAQAAQSAAGSSPTFAKPPTEVDGVTYPADELTNVTKPILSKIHRGLHRRKNHPIFILRNIIEQHFVRSAPGTYAMFDSLHPIVTPKQNFDDLLFADDHVGRLPTDTYFLNKDYLLRTHTSAHQAELLRQGSTDFLVAADVYRRDEIDRSHYPVFHQMEGVRTFKRGAIEPVPDRTDSSVTLIDDTTIGGPSNPVQPGHTEEEARALAASLKHALNGLIREMFKDEKDLTIRWVEAYFPFTSPSYEVEIMYQGKWLEVLGCGVMRQEILDNNGMSDRVGWAFGIGIERLAMVLFDVPDIRLFWSDDDRVVSQFKDGKIAKFKPFSKYSVCYKDISFWYDVDFHENDFCELVRNVAGDLVEDVKLIDEFSHPKTKRKSKCYRINYQSMDRNVTNDEIDEIHLDVTAEIVDKLKVDVR
ncbi:Phenylalanyl-tRNA synthetase [Hyaloraphidium curvatum]|nr:Phenylalanyl-tRNA synthetase [Hyaloraphidium curvatum]